MAGDPDSTEPDAADPANLAEAVPSSDRGQGSIGSTQSQAVAEAAAEGVDLSRDADGPPARN